nr:alpha bag cell peptide [Aplysia californica]
APRLRFYSL